MNSLEHEMIELLKVLKEKYGVFEQALWGQREVWFTDGQ